MNKFKITTLVASLLLVLIPATVSATAILRSGETVNITNDQVVEGDFYAGGGVVSHSGVVKEDMYAIAGSLTNNGLVEGDLTVVGGTIQMHASVTDDVRVIGGEIVVAGSVGGDLVVFGGLLKVLSTASVEGDILFFGGDLEVLGPVEGSIMGHSETVRVDSHVGKSIDLTAGKLTLGDRAEVVGDVRYVSNNEVIRSQNAVVVGEVVRNTKPVETEVPFDSLVISFIIMLFSALVMQLVFRKQLEQHLEEFTSQVGLAGLIGIAVLILTPVIILVAIASMLGTLVGIILLTLFLTLIFIAFAFASILVGALIGKYGFNATGTNVLYTVFGAVSIQLLMLVPVLGQALVFVIFFVTLGALSRRIFLALRS